MRRLGPPRSALSGARASPPSTRHAAGRNNCRRPPLLPLPLPSPPRRRSRRLRVPPPPPLPPPTTPSLSLFYMRRLSPSYCCRRIGRARRGAVTVVVALLLQSRDVFDPDGSRPWRSPSFWRWWHRRVPPPRRRLHRRRRCPPRRRRIHEGGPPAPTVPRHATEHVDEFPRRPHRRGRRRVILKTRFLLPNLLAPPPPPPSPPSPPWKKRDTAMPPVRFNLVMYRRTPAVRRSRLITLAIVPLSSLSSPPPPSPPRAVAVVAAAVAAVVSIALRMNPSTFLPRAVRCIKPGGPPSGIIQGASSPTPLLPPLSSAAADDDQRSVDAVRDLLSCGGVRHHLLLYN